MATDMAREERGGRAGLPRNEAAAQEGPRKKGGGERSSSPAQARHRRRSLTPQHDALFAHHAPGNQIARGFRSTPAEAVASIIHSPMPRNPTGRAGPNARSRPSSCSFWPPEIKPSPCDAFIT